MGFSASFDISSSTLLGDTILGIWGLRQSQEELSALKCLWCQVLEGSGLPPLYTNTRLCIRGIVCRWVQLGQLSEHYAKQEQYTKGEMSNKQYRQTLARQWWCLQKQGNVYRQRSWKSSNTSAQIICLPSANTSCSLKICLNWPLLQENTVLFQKQIGELNLFHMEEREPFVHILVGMRLQHYNVLSEEDRRSCPQMPVCTHVLLYPTRDIKSSPMKEEHTPLCLCSALLDIFQALDAKLNNH